VENENQNSRWSKFKEKKKTDHKRKNQRLNHLEKKRQVSGESWQKSKK